MKRFVPCVLMAVILATWPLLGNMNAFAATAAPDAAEIQKTMGNAAAFLMTQVKDPGISQVGGEWVILGLARSGIAVPASYYQIYMANAEKELTEKGGVLSSTKYTEYSRLILAMTAIGQDVTNAGGYNLLDKLADLNNITKQGVNGPVFALLALDSHGYGIPGDAAAAVTAAGGTPTTRDALIHWLVERGPVAGDADRTAMMLQALAKYKDRKDVAAFGEKAFAMIDDLEGSDGNFAYGGLSSSESVSQVIVARTMWGLDCGKNVRTLMGYTVTGGGFEHVKGGGADMMATEQAMYALATAYRNQTGKTLLYDMSDVPLTGLSGISVTVNGTTVIFDQPPVIENSRTLVPMRAIFEAMGAQVSWDPDTATVTGVKDNRVIKLTIGSTRATVNGASALLEVPAKIINGRTMVPVRFILESLDAKVDWIPATRTVVIIK